MNWNSSICQLCKFTLFSLQVVRLQNGVEVTWLYRKRQFTVDLPTTFQTKVCGLCGNYNGDKDDDWIMGSGELCSNRDFNEGQLVSQDIAKMLWLYF